MRWVSNKCLRRFSYDCARQALTLNKICLSLDNLETKTFCIIGDGYGSLGCLIKKVFPKSKIISINLGRTLFFDVYYSQKSFPELEHKLIRTNQDKFCEDFNYVEAENIKNIIVYSDIFINIVSMQEMNYQDKYLF